MDGTPPDDLVGRVERLEYVVSRLVFDQYHRTSPDVQDKLVQIATDMRRSRGDESDREG